MTDLRHKIPYWLAYLMSATMLVTAGLNIFEPEPTLTAARIPDNLSGAFLVHMVLLAFGGLLLALRPRHRLAPLFTLPMAIYAVLYIVTSPVPKNVVIYGFAYGVVLLLMIYFRETNNG